MAKKIILDCDPGHDDAVAILLALAASHQLDLLGLTVVGGNVPLKLTVDNALRVLALANRSDIPVHAGCPRPLIREVVTAEHVHGESGLAWIIHEITYAARPNPSAPPFPVANPAQSTIQSVLRSFTESATASLAKIGFGERIRRFMNSPG